MAMAHKKGIVHRDLKPPNIMLCSEGGREHVVKLLDFGVARTSGALKIVHTNNKTIVGTPGYMSPEAATGLGTDGRTDVFSLAVILYEMLTSVLPFPLPPDADAYMGYVQRLLNLPPPTVTTFRLRKLDPVPAEVEEVIARALEKEPSKRYRMVEFQTALRQRLEAIANASGGVVRSPMATMLSTTTLPDEPASKQPTLTTPSGEIDALLSRMQTPVPAATIDGHHTPAPVRAPSRIAGVLLGIAAVFVAMAIGIGVWTMRRSTQPEPVPVATEAKPPAPPPTVTHAPAPVPPPSRPAPAPTGRIRIITTPPGATVAVDGEAVGQTPLDLVGKPDETRRIVLSLDGYLDRNEDVPLPPEGGTAEFQLHRPSGHRARPVKAVPPSPRAPKLKSRPNADQPADPFGSGQ